MKIDINGVSITLTKEQLEEIARQTSRIKTFKDITSFKVACEYQNINLSRFNSKLNGLSKSEIALRKLKIIVKAIRSFTNWKPNFKDSSQSKWRVCFDLETGFSCYDVDCTHTDTCVPSALYVGTNAEANHLGNTFLVLFNDFILED